MQKKSRPNIGRRIRQYVRRWKQLMVRSECLPPFAKNREGWGTHCLVVRGGRPGHAPRPLDLLYPRCVVHRGGSDVAGCPGKAGICCHSWASLDLRTPRLTAEGRSLGITDKNCCDCTGPFNCDATAIIAITPHLE